MLPKLRIITVAGVVVLGGLLGIGAGRAEAQIFINTPGVSLGLGAPAYGLYGGGYGLYPGYGIGAPLVGAYPVPVRPYPYAYGRPGFYGPRYGHYGYRRW
jgi:hypothetical protein